MNDLVGIIRTGEEMQRSLEQIEVLKTRAANVRASGGRAYNPGWHLALDLPRQLLVSECIARAALTREESRGGHTRNDFPKMDPEWRTVNLICRENDGHIEVYRQDLPSMPTEFISMFDVAELTKYMTKEEIDSLAQGTA